MRYLNQLVDDHLPSLAGAEFKVAAFLYRRLERRQLVEMTIAELALATGVCAKQVHVVAKHLRNTGLLRIESRRGHATKYSLPSCRHSVSGIVTSLISIDSPLFNRGPTTRP